MEAKQYTVGELMELGGGSRYSHEVKLQRNYAQRKALGYSLVRVAGRTVLVAYIFQGTKGMFGFVNGNKVSPEEAMKYIVSEVEFEHGEVPDDTKRKILLRSI